MGDALDGEGGTLAKEAKRAVFQRKHTAQMGSLHRFLSFLFVVEDPFTGSILPRTPGTACTFCRWQANPRCVTDGGGEAKSEALVSRLLENKSYLLLLSGQP